MFAPILASLLLAQLPQAPAVPDSGLTVKVDSAAHQVILTAGPFNVPAMAEGPMMHMQHMAAPVLRFAWPVNGWLRGAHLELRDGSGQVIDARMVHHLNLINFGRRQLFYHAFERLLALGTETGDISLPKTVGVPVSAGMPMGLILVWHNGSGKDVQGAVARLVLTWTPTTQVPKPVSVLPLYMDVVDPVGRDVSFDLPAGKSSFHADFTMPIDGRILGIGGHMHDFGTGMRLEDITDAKPRTVVRLRTTLAPNGEITAVDRKLPGVSGDGIKLERGHKYRLVGTYDNTTGEKILDGAMIHMVGIFTPDDSSAWPALVADDPLLQKDLGHLASGAEMKGYHAQGHGANKGAGMGAMPGMDHSH